MMEIQVCFIGEADQQLIDELRREMSAAQCSLQCQAITDLECLTVDDERITLSEVVVVLLPQVVIGHPDEKRMHRWQQKLAVFSAKLVRRHGAWGHLSIVVAGSPSEKIRPTSPHHPLKSKVTEWLNLSKVGSKELAKAIRNACNRSWWSTEKQGALPAIIIRTGDNKIVRANHAAQRMFGKNRLDGYGFNDICHDDHGMFSKQRWRDSVPKIVSLNRIPQEHSEEGTFRANIICHPIPAPGPSENSELIRNPPYVVVWVLDQSGQNAITEAIETLHRSATMESLLDSVVKIATKLGFSRTRLYRYDKTTLAMYGIAQVGFDESEAIEFFKDGGFKLSTIEGDERFDPTTKIILDHAEGKSHLLPFVVITKDLQAQDDWVLDGQCCSTKSSARFQAELHKKGIDRWIEAPILVRQGEGDKEESKLWGKLSFDRGSPSNDITAHDLQHIEVFSRVVGEQIVVWETQNAELEVVKLVDQYSKPISEAIAGDTTSLLNTDSLAMRIGHHAYSLPSLDIIIASVLNLFLEHTNAKIAIYREYDEVHHSPIRQIGPPVFKCPLYAENLSIPTYFEPPDKELDLFPSPDRLERVNRPKDLQAKIACYLGSKKISDEKELSYYRFLNDELQITVRPGNEPIGVVCLISDDPNAFRIIPKIVEQLQPIASVWIDLVSRQNSRNWLADATRRISKQLSILNQVDVYNDQAWFSGLAAILTASEGLQWNRIFVFDSDAICRPNAMKLVLALGGLCGEKEKEHVKLQGIIKSKYDHRFEELIQRRVVNPDPMDGADTVDELYELVASGKINWVISDEELGLGALFETLSSPDIKYEKLSLNSRLDVAEECRNIHPDLFHRDDDLYAFSLQTASGNISNLASIIVLSMRQGGDHRIDDMIHATLQVLATASYMLTIRKLKAYWQGWNRNAPQLFHDSRTVQYDIPSVRDWLKNATTASPIPPEGFRYLSRSIELLQGVYEKPREATCVFEDVVHLVRRDWDGEGTQKHISIKFENPQCKLTLPCDKLTLYRVFKELLTNSVDAQRRLQNQPPVNASISTVVSDVAIGPINKKYKVIEIHYRDSGPGLSDDERKCAFIEGISGNIENGGAIRGKGLSLQRARLMAFGGDIQVVGSTSGAHFVISFYVGD